MTYESTKNLTSIGAYKDLLLSHYFSPKYWLLRSSGRWLLYIFILQVAIIWSAPYIVGLMSDSTVLSIREYLFDFFVPAEDSGLSHQHITNAITGVNAASTQALVVGAIFWLLCVPETIAVYYMLVNSGREKMIATILTKDRPDIKNMLIEGLWMDVRKYTGKMKKIGLFRRVFVSFFSMLLGGLSIWMMLSNKAMWAVGGDFSSDPFLNMIIMGLACSIFANFLIIPVRDYIKWFINPKQQEVTQ